MEMIRYLLNRRDIICEALRRFFAVREFRKLRGVMVPLAEEKGLYKDEDVFRRVS